MKLLIIISSILLLSCGPERRPIETSRHGDYDVHLLFEKDSCKMYRFTDNGNYIYWCNCEGKVSYQYETGGKVRTTHKVETVISNSAKLTKADGG